MLAQQIKENSGLADLILIEVSAVFLRAVANMQGNPEIFEFAQKQRLDPAQIEEPKLVDPKKQAIPEVAKAAPIQRVALGPIKKEIMREVLVKTRKGTGNNYSHPANPHFNNPITAVHQYD